MIEGGKNQNDCLAHGTKLPYYSTEQSCIWPSRASLYVVYLKHNNGICIHWRVMFYVFSQCLRNTCSVFTWGGLCTISYNKGTLSWNYRCLQFKECFSPLVSHYVHLFFHCSVWLSPGSRWAPGSATSSTRRKKVSIFSTFISLIIMQIWKIGVILENRNAMYL